MKKTTLALVMMGCSSLLFAQETGDTTARSAANNADSLKIRQNSGMTNPSQMTNPNMNNNSMNNSWSSGDTTMRASSMGAYSAYGPVTSIPSTVQFNFQRDYPSATGAAWSQNNEYYRVNYTQNGQNMSVFYSPAGESFMLALPVLESSVPAEVVSKAREMYGYNIYDITTLRGVNGQEYYGVRVLDNGNARLERIMADGSMVADSIWNFTHNTGMNNMNGNWNNAGDSTMNQMNKGDRSMDSTGQWNNSGDTTSGNWNNTNSGDTTTGAMNNTSGNTTTSNNAASLSAGDGTTGTPAMGVKGAFAQGATTDNSNTGKPKKKDAKKDRKSTDQQQKDQQ